MNCNGLFVKNNNNKKYRTIQSSFIKMYGPGQGHAIPYPCYNRDTNFPVQAGQHATTTTISFKIFMTVNFTVLRKGTKNKRLG